MIDEFVAISLRYCVQNFAEFLFVGIQYFSFFLEFCSVDSLLRERSVLCLLFKY